MPENVSRPGHFSITPKTPAHPTVRLGAAFARLLLSKWCNSVQVKGLDRFLTVLRDEERKRRGRGILTYANHISVIDDPTIFGALPKDTFRLSSTTRWTLGASDIMFTNRLFSAFFRQGQVMATDRGRGVFQPSLDRSIELLEAGNWVHMFPEGYVNLSRKALLRRFKWGIGRLLLEAGKETSTRPLIIPIWISGLDRMMPEPRRFPRWFPRPGADVTITFGEPINKTMDPILDRLASFISTHSEVKRHQEDAPTYSQVQSEAEKSIEDLEQLGPSYPSPPANSFPPHTPLVEPPNGVPWPVPLVESRSAKAVGMYGDSLQARVARSLIAAELRAQLFSLGEKQGGNMALSHQLMPLDDMQKK